MEAFLSQELRPLDQHEITGTGSKNFASKSLWVIVYVMPLYFQL